MLTEPEARAKWCPFARVHLTHISGGASINRGGSLGDGGPIPGTYCIASACAAWRWADQSQAEGYCGLAGQPVARAA